MKSRSQLINVRQKRGVHYNVHYDATDNTWSLDTMMVVLLSDIRDELAELNRLLGCRNFTELPKTLRQVEENTRRRPRKAGTAVKP